MNIYVLYATVNILTSGCQNIKVHTQDKLIFKKITFLCTTHANCAQCGNKNNICSSLCSRKSFYSNSRPVFRKACPGVEVHGDTNAETLWAFHFSCSKAGMLMFQPMAWRSKPHVKRLQMGWSSHQAQQQTILLWPCTARRQRRYWHALRTPSATLPILNLLFANSTENPKGHCYLRLQGQSVHNDVTA